MFDFTSGLKMNTLKEFRKIFQDLSIYKSEIRPVLSILAISELSKNYSQIQSILKKMDQPQPSSQVMHMLEPVCGKINDTYKVNSELKVWLCNPDDANEFTVDQALVRSYAELLWAEFNSFDDSELKQEIIHDLPHLLVITNEWQKPIHSTESYVNFINLLFKHQAYASTIVAAKALLEKFNGDERSYKQKLLKQYFY